MTKLVNFTAAAAFAITALVVADTAVAKDEYKDDSYGSAYIVKEKHGKDYKKECYFYDDKYKQTYKAEKVEVEYAGNSDHVKELKCIFYNEYKPRYNIYKEDFKCKVEVKSYDDKYREQEKTQYTYDSRWILDTYGNGKMKCYFNDDDHKDKDDEKGDH